MKKQNYFFIIIATLIFPFWMACSGGGSDSEEPNNTIEEAKPIEFDQALDFTIQPVGDLDWYVVEAKEKGYLKLMASNVPEDLVLEFKVAQFKEWEGEKEKYITDNWINIPGAVMLLDTGHYYIVVKEEFDDAESDQKANLKVSFTPQFDDGEPNQEPETATEAKFGESFKIAIYPMGDVDWYKFKSNKEGFVRMMTKEVPAADFVPQFSVYTYDEWADPKVKQIRDWQNFPNSFYVPDSGTYYVQFIEEYNDMGADKLFEIRSEFLVQNDTLEPNDEFAQAAVVNRGDTLQMAIFPKGDVDYYKIKVVEGDTIRISAKDYDESAILPQARIMAIDPNDPNNLIEKSDYKNLPADFAIAPNEEFFIIFKDEYDDGEAYEKFSVLIE